MTGKEQKNTKKMQHNPEVEASLLGCLLFKNDSIFSVNSIITSMDFYGAVHKKIYDCMFELYGSGLSFDSEVVKQKLISLNLIEEIGGTEYIDYIEKISCSINVVSQYARIIKDLSLKRSIANISDKYLSISTNEYDSTESEVIISDFISDISSINKNFDDRMGFATNEDAIYDLFEGEEGRIIKTGLSCVDEECPIMTQGLTIVAAQPSHGKTSIAIELGFGAAEFGYRTDFYSLEMSKAQLFSRILSNKMRKANSFIPYRDLYRKDLREKISHEELLKARHIATEVPKINWNDASEMTVTDILMNSMNCKDIKDSPDLIIVDYLDNLSLSDMDKSLRHDQQLGQVAKKLRAFSKEYDCAVILVVQLNRGSTGDNNFSRPVLRSLKNSGELGQDVDTAIFVYKKSKIYEEKYGDDMTAEQAAEYQQLLGEIELIIGKQRMGSTGSLIMRAEIQYNYFACDQI